MMDVFSAIQQRQSIRKFKDEAVPQDMLDKILEAATLAPSGKNKQPWKFYIVRGGKRAEMVEEMKKGMNRLESLGIKTGSARYTTRVLDQAPVTILVFNPTSKHPLKKRNTLETYQDMVDIQSIGAAIQNMCLTAVSLGLGSLWICDVYFGYEELCEWLGESGELIAALSLGYPNHTPVKRPRQSVAEVAAYIE